MKNAAAEHHCTACTADGKAGVGPGDEGLTIAAQRRLSRRLFRRLLPPAIRRWLRGRLAPLLASGAARRIDGWRRPYRYTPPARPADLEARLAQPGMDISFSIVTPTWNTPPELLQAMLRSVQDQWYPRWQLILADDASTAEETQKALDAIDDPRVKVLRTAENGGISEATNRAIVEARGDYIVFLDHDDALSVDCLYELAKAIAETGADYLYSDEDKLSPEGRYVEPFFKPDWSPDALMSIMYTGHVSCVRRSLLAQTGLLRRDYDGSQDWDLVLRIAEKAERIVHIPRVLYHWRINPGSAAGDAAAKPYAIDAGRRARIDALARRGVSGELEPIDEAKGYFRVRPHVQGAPLISIIIPSKNNGAVLSNCLASIRARSTWAHYELVLIDNGSDDAATLAIFADQQALGATVIRHDAPFNYSEINNIGVRAAQGELLLFLNDDTEVVTPDWLERMAGFAQLAHVGAVGAKLLYPGNGLVQHVGVINIGNGPVHAFQYANPANPGYFLRNVLEYNWLAVTGACLMISRNKFDEISGFNEHMPVAYNDVDLCMRLSRAGYFNVVTPAVRLLHYESITRGDDLDDPVKLARLNADRETLYAGNPQFRGRDPFYNPNLSQHGVHFALP